MKYLSLYVKRKHLHKTSIGSTPYDLHEYNQLLLVQGLSVHSTAITFVFFYFGNWNEICLIICQIILNFNSFYPISLKLKTLPSNINSFHPIWLSVIGSSSVQSTAITFVLFDFAIFLWIYMKNTSIQLSFNPIWLANEYNCYWLRDLFPPIHCNYFWGFLTMSIFY